MMKHATSCRTLIFSAVAMVAIHCSTYGLNAYYVGNSLTDNISYWNFATSCESMGKPLTWGRHMVPGTPLLYLWRNPGAGIPEQPYGLYPNALQNYEWDIITLQPYDWGVNDELEGIKNFANLAKTKSPQVQLFVYAQWPLRSNDYQSAWLSTSFNGSYKIMTNGVASCRTKEFYEMLATRAQQEVEGVKKVLMVPNGHVFYELDKLARAGQLPGYATASDFYADETHLNAKGCYVVGCALYAVAFKEKPEGFPPSAYGVSQEAAVIIQNVTWQVALQNELCGIEQTGGTFVSAPAAGAVRPLAVRPETSLRVMTINGRTAESIAQQGNHAARGLYVTYGLGRTTFELRAK